MSVSVTGFGYARHGRSLARASVRTPASNTSIYPVARELYKGRIRSGRHPHPPPLHGKPFDVDDARGPAISMHEREIRRRIALHPIEGSPTSMRASFEALADLSVDLRGCRMERLNSADLPIDVIRPPRCVEGVRIVYLHGGGYVFGSARSHRRLAIELAVSSGCELWLPDYPLAPEHGWPQQRSAVAKLVRAAIAGDDGIGDTRIVLGGDSAGGHLALATLLAGEPGSTAILGVVLFSPNTLRDYSLTRTRLDNAAVDAMNDPEQDDALVRMALGDYDPADPELTLVNGRLDALPPLYLDVGGSEILLDDSLVFARAAALAGVRVELKVRPGVFHMSQLFAQHWWRADDSVHAAGRWTAALAASVRSTDPA